MSLLGTLKSLFGQREREPTSSDVSVTVERDSDSSEQNPVEEHSPTDSDPSMTAAATQPGPGGAETTAEAQDEQSADEAFEWESEDEPSPDGESSTESEPLTSITGIGPAYAESLEDAGIDTVQQLADADAFELADAAGLSDKRVEGWVEQARARNR